MWASHILGCAEGGVWPSRKFAYLIHNTVVQASRIVGVMPKFPRSSLDQQEGHPAGQLHRVFLQLLVCWPLIALKCNSILMFENKSRKILKLQPGKQNTNMARKSIKNLPIFVKKKIGTTSSKKLHLSFLWDNPLYQGKLWLIDGSYQERTSPINLAMEIYRGHIFDDPVQARTCHQGPHHHLPSHPPFHPAFSCWI